MSNDVMATWTAADAELLVQRFVGEVLQEKHVDRIPEIFAPDFIDRDPSAGQLPGREGVEQAVLLLMQEGTESTFTLEAARATPEVVAYRIFGSGVGYFWDEQRGRPVLDAFITSSIGVFFVAGGRLIERWGLWLYEHG